MKKISIFLLLMAFFAPFAMNGQTTNQLLSENFDSMSSISTTYSGTGWFAYNAGSGNNWSLNTSSTYANSGSKSAQYSYNSSNPANCYLVSAPFSVSANMTELEVSLYEAVRSGSYQETFEVFFVKASDVSSAAGVASATNYNAIASASYNNTSFAQKTGSVTNSALAGQSVRVVVHCTSAKDRWNLYIDDIVVTETVAAGPTITLTPSSATVMRGFSETLTAAVINVTGTPTISYSSSNTGVATVTGDGTTTATVTGVSNGTATITATMNYQGTNYTATSTITVVEPSYCTPVYNQESNNYGIWITGFSTTEGETNISTSSNGLSTNGYGDYYNSYSASAEAGQVISFTVTPGNSVNAMIYSMWIDWNQDYDFNDAGEIVAQQNSGITTSWTGTIHIPASAPAGNYRIRIEGMYFEENSGVFDPCISATYGEAEDYKLIVLPAASCPKPSNLQLTALGNEVTATWEGSAVSYNIDINGTVTPNATTTNSYTFTGNLSTTYNVKVQANCEGNETSDWSTEKSVTTDACLFENQCPLTITLTDAYGDGGGSMYVVDANTETILAELILSGASQEFQVYACDGTEVDFYFYATDNYAYENGYVITDPDGEVIAEHVGCTSSSSCDAPTDGVVASYTMNCSCFAPSELTAEVTLNTAELSWIGGQDSYNVRSREVFFLEDFEGGAMPTGWTTINNDGDSYNWNYDNQNSHGHSGTGVMTSASSVNTTSSGWVDFEPDNWLVSPQLDLQGTMSVWVRSQNNEASYDKEHFAIYISTTGTNVSDFSELVPENVTTIEYVEYTANLSAYAGQKGYIAIRHFNCEGQFRMNIDDFGLYGSWAPQNTNQASASLEGLSSASMYEFQVQGVNCDGNGNNTDWSPSVYFTTPEFYIKHIDAYSSDGGYYLIASPLANAIAPTQVGGMITDNEGGNATTATSTYDLYSFDQAQEDEWRNYRASSFNLVNGQGYLYASKNSTDLVFTGAAGTNGTVTLSKTTGAEFEGHNLVGNPFGVEAYIGKPYYRMNQGGTEVLSDAGTGAIAVMEGVFVLADNNEENLTFSTTPVNRMSANLNLNLVKDAKVIDRAIVNFSDEQQLPKFQINRNSTKVYIPQEGKDYAVVSSQSMGEMPVNFKAENNGSYTLSFTTEEVSFAYLHLIDNMTGIETDLLANPSYSFDARTTDYESRFKLVFATGNNANDDNFAFFSNGSFVINNEGEATLQVIDINGRILKSESINGCANVNVNAAQGIYMLRLVNGDSVKVQKVVVR